MPVQTGTCWTWMKVMVISLVRTGANLIPKTLGTLCSTHPPRSTQRSIHDLSNVSDFQGDAWPHLTYVYAVISAVTGVGLALVSCGNLDACVYAKRTRDYEYTKRPTG